MPHEPSTQDRSRRTEAPFSADGAAYLKPHRGKLTFGFLAMIGVALAEVARPWPLKIVFDGILIPQENPDTVTAWLTGIFGSGDGRLRPRRWPFWRLPLSVVRLGSHKPI